MKVINFLYSLLFLYIVLALLFWGKSLLKQNDIIFEKETHILKDEIDSVRFSPQYYKSLSYIKIQSQKRTSQYLGEGATFLVLIIIGAAIVYSSIRRNHKLNQQQNNFMLSITHELKSPIAAVKLNLQTLDKRVLPDDIKHKLLDGSITEMNRLNDLCNNLLLASKIENKGFDKVAASFSLSELAEECIETFNMRSKHQIVTDIDENCVIEGDRLMIQLAMHNLIENATKYAPANTEIAINLKNEDTEAVFSVSDHGNGIPDIEKGKIFKKFYRVGDENSRKTKGTGLGLYLTAQIVKLHKGTIIVSDNKPNGAIFEIHIPLA